jgi:hypothetical protein
VAFASSHLKGSVSFEYGTGSSFSTYLGWVLPWGEPLTLVGSQEDAENAIRDLSRSGIDSPDAARVRAARAGPAGCPRLVPRVGWDGVLAGLLQWACRDVVHIDARFADAEAAGIVLETTAA